MKIPKNLNVVLLSNKQWERIADAIEKGNDRELQRILEETRIISNEAEIRESELSELELEQQKEKEVEETEKFYDATIPKVSGADLLYFIQTGINYEKSREEVMDSLVSYMKRNNISKSTLRYVVENLDDDYTLKYYAKYNQDVREFVSRDDIEAIVNNEIEEGEQQKPYSYKAREEDDRKEYEEIEEGDGFEIDFDI